MYLQALELIGFKSFAERTQLMFQPGLTAIVGPNGCGKSNVADAVRWALGEQSAKALRGAKMEDCIFNGTDDRKPMGMAEVSLTFAACEDVLGTDYHEVTVTRRVFRSGEGQYFMNKTPCRLKDIQRLFLGTGVGTTSYSLMEQGRIDQVLSSRPEDRRAVFEEASGITRFKTDKREALRKLEQTEANLLRLSDVIREVKRQIGSVQRQAGKARRYQVLRDELRNLETERARHLLGGLDRRLADLTSENGTAEETLAAAETVIADLASAENSLRLEIAQLDETAGQAMRIAADYRSQLERNRDLIRVTRERIDEQARLVERDTAEITAARQRQAEQQELSEKLRDQLQDTREHQRLATTALAEKNKQWQAHETAVAAARSRIEELRRETLEAEAALARLQNELTALEQSERSTVLRRERLLVEQEQSQSTAEAAEARVKEMTEQIQVFQAGVTETVQTLSELQERRKAIRGDAAAVDDRLKELRTSMAGASGQLEILRAAEAAAQDYPGGARALLASEPDPERPPILGPLAHAIEVDDGYLPAVDAVLRPIADALLVEDRAAAMAALNFAVSRKAGSLRLAALQTPDADGARLDAWPPDALLRHIRCATQTQPLLNRLLAGVRVVDSPNSIPADLVDGERLVTLDGLLLRPDGVFEYRDQAEAADDPLARRQRILELQRRCDIYLCEIDDCRETWARFQRELNEIETSLEQQQRLAEERRRALALQEGQSLVISRDADKARQRLKTLAWELEQLENRNRDNGLKKGSLATRMGEIHERRETDRRRTEDYAAQLQTLERERSPLFDQVSEQRLRTAEINQTLQHLEHQMPAAASRLAEIGQLIEDREAAIATASDSIARMRNEASGAEARIGELQAASITEERKASVINGTREDRLKNLNTALESLNEQRQARDRLHARQAELQVAIAEHRLQIANLVERMAADYNVSETDLRTSPAAQDACRPGEPSEPVDATTRDDRILELKSRIEAMGAVNLVAIEEYRELEERHAFLAGQHDDLVAARASLLDTIRRINTSTSEMFTRTFEQVNQNFQTVFEKLFNGGKARLELTDAEDVLEAGIDIIARPPGKRPQSISLLSGGERTLTAVALLFAIYMIKPSPFCLLDEIDAALDETNINRFLNILEGFLDQSQFIVITHNRRTIAAAGVIYGVTMPENGLSRILSMKFLESGATTSPAPDTVGQTDATSA